MCKLACLLEYIHLIGIMTTNDLVTLHDLFLHMIAAVLVAAYFSRTLIG